MDSEEIKEEEEFKMFDGYFRTYTMHSKAIDGKMKFGVYFPPNVVKNEDKDKKFPALWYLHGLTCHESLFFQKASLGLKKAADLGLMMLFPDTSPRDDVQIEGDRKDWDFGVAASYYVDATEGEWAKHYNMYTHVTKELREVIERNFPVDPVKQSISGHSVGGHGSLVLYQKNLDRYVSCSAFAPMTNAINSDWGKKAFTNFFGENQEKWNEYDACELAKQNNGKNVEILVDQGDKDNFYPDKLLTENFEKAGKDNGHNFHVNLREGYDHGFGFINSFIESHLDYHWERLNK